MSNAVQDLVIQFNSFFEYFVISVNYSSIHKFSFRKKKSNKPCKINKTWVFVVEVKKGRHISFKN